MNTAELFKALQENKGFTVSGTGQAYTGQGYAVSLTDNETKIVESELNFERFTTIVNNYSELAAAIGINTYVGAWIDSGTVYFDISEIFEEKKQAETVAKERKQLAIFSFENFETIYL